MAGILARPTRSGAEAADALERGRAGERCFAASTRSRLVARTQHIGTQSRGTREQADNLFDQTVAHGPELAAHARSRNLGKGHAILLGLAVENREGSSRPPL